MKVVLCTIIVVITSNLIRKITLNILFSVSCCEVRFSFSLLSMGRRWALRTLNFNQVSYERTTLHNHCSYSLKPNSKEHSEYAVLCCEVQQIFFLALHGKTLSYKNFEF